MDNIDLNSLPKTPKEAKEIGSKFYFTGKPCKNGHTTKRYTTGACEKYMKEYQKEYKKEYRKNNLHYVITRSTIHRLLGLKPTGIKVYQVDELLGYSAQELREYLESLFQEGMTWENWGEWHIDHIKPVAQFKREGITDPKIINALSNLQPLWAEENLKKSDKLLDDLNETL